MPLRFDQHRSPLSIITQGGRTVDVVLLEPRVDHAHELPELSR
jgi:hypothetical protein